MGSNTMIPVAKMHYLSWVNLAATSADQIATIALPVLYVDRYNGDASATSILTIAATLPMLLLSMPLGALTDRSPLRSILFWGELVRLISILGMILLLNLPSPSINALAAMALIGGTGTVAFQVAAPAMVARAAEGNERRKLNSSIELARSVAVTAGPPLAGAVVGLAGGDIALTLAASCGLGALVTTRRLPALPVSAPASIRPIHMLLDGVRFALGNQWLRPILAISMAFNLAWYTILGVIIAWANRELGMSSALIGVMFGCYGVGMITGALLLNRVGDRYSSTMLVQIGPWCGFCFATLVALSTQVGAAWLLMLAFFLIGCGPVIWTITTVGIRQNVTPSHLLGRVSATIMMASAGARPIGAAAGYATYEFGGYAAVFGVALVLFGAQALMVGQTSLSHVEPPAHNFAAQSS